MQKRKALLPLGLLILAILLPHLSAFGDEQKKKVLTADGWRLELTDAMLTKEVGNVVKGGLRALPDKSILILYFNIKYINAAVPIETIKNVLKNAVILDADTGKRITCPSIGTIKSSFSTEQGRGTDSEARYTPSPSMETAIKKGQVTRISYTACIEGNSKKLLLVVPNLGKVELENLILERESLWQGPRPNPSLDRENTKE